MDQRGGRGAAGDVKPYDRLPMFFTDQYDMGVEYRGLAPGFDEVIVRGSVGAGELLTSSSWNDESSEPRQRQHLGHRRRDRSPPQSRAEPSPDRRAVADWETPLSELI